MNVYLNFYTGLSIVLMAIITALCRWRQVDLTGKIFFTSMVWYFFTQFVSEGGLLYKDISRNYMTFYYVVRNIQPPIELALGALFFHHAIPELRQRNLAYWLLPLGIGIWLAMAVIFRKEENFNVYYGPLVCVSNILLAIVSLNYLHSKAEFRDLLKLPVFRFTLLYLFFYGFSFFFFVSYPFILQNREAELFAVYIVFRLTDIYYVGASITYFLYPKKVIRT